jgi:hypothetical protein
MSATITTAAPPSEQEIRSLVTARMDAPEGSSGTTGGNLRDDLRHLIDDAGQWLRYPAWYVLEAVPADAGPEDPTAEDPNAFPPPAWRNLRPSEAERLRALIAEAAGRADTFDAFKQPNRLMVAMANIALPVLLDRHGGFATWTDDEFTAIARRYGCTVAVTMERTKNGRWEARLKRGKPRKAAPSDS